MPVTCSIEFPRLSNDEMLSVDYKVMGCAFAAQAKLGRLCDESIYQGELLKRLKESGIETRSEIPLELAFRDYSTRLALDVVVQQKVIYELKVVEAFSSAHEAQLLGYLYLTNSTRGKLINFRTQSVESRFVNTTLDDNDRRKFSIETGRYDGDARLVLLVRELVQDWGTGLDAALYRKPILHFLSCESEPERMMPMMSDGEPIGNQRFHLLGHRTAIAVTTYPDVTAGNVNNFSKLVLASPLERMHWVNITHHLVTITTIGTGGEI